MSKYHLEICRASSVAYVVFIGLVASLIDTARADSGGHGWNYDTVGPDVWPHEFTNCKGLKQSPINIVKSELEYDQNLKPFKFYNYDKNFRWNVSHNGHTVVLTRVEEEAGSNVEIGVEGSDFDKKFHLLQFHFHWGYNNFQGSEHLVEGEKFPLEMHLVHRSKSGAFTVLGFLFKLSDQKNPRLNDLVEGVNATRTQSHSEIVELKLESMLPDVDSLENYYRYSGSLTTPPCTEGVIWNLFTSHINISSFQLKSFRNNIMKMNFREPQKMYSRKAFSSFKVNENKQHKSETKQDACAKSSAIAFESLNIFKMGTLSVVMLIISSTALAGKWAF